MLPFFQGHKSLDQVKQDAERLFEAHYTIHGLKNPEEKAKYSIAALKTRRGQLILSSLIDYAVFEFDRIPEPKGFPKSLYDVWLLPDYYANIFRTIMILERDLRNEGSKRVFEDSRDEPLSVWLKPGPEDKHVRNLNFQPGPELSLRRADHGRRVYPFVELVPG